MQLWVQYTRDGGPFKSGHESNSPDSPDSPDSSKIARLEMHNVCILVHSRDCSIHNSAAHWRHQRQFRVLRHNLSPLWLFYISIATLASDCCIHNRCHHLLYMASLNGKADVTPIVALASAPPVPVPMPTVASCCTPISITWRDVGVTVDVPPPSFFQRRSRSDAAHVEVPVEAALTQLPLSPSPLGLDEKQILSALKKPILSGVSGYCEPGQLLAVMGSSGAGQHLLQATQPEMLLLADSSARLPRSQAKPVSSTYSRADSATMRARCFSMENKPPRH